MRAFAAAAAAIAIAAAALGLSSAQSAPAACPYQAQVVAYNPRGWQPLLCASLRIECRARPRV